MAFAWPDNTRKVSGSANAARLHGDDGSFDIRHAIHSDSVSTFYMNISLIVREKVKALGTGGILNSFSNFTVKYTVTLNNLSMRNTY